MLGQQSTLGQFIARLLDEHGMTLVVLAEKLGIHPSNAGRKVKGETKITFAERKKIAAVFSLSLEEFDAQWSATASNGHRGIPVINRSSLGEVIDHHHHRCAEPKDNDAWQYIDRGVIGAVDAFAIIVVGDSMEPSLRDGDLCVLLPVIKGVRVRQPKPRQIVFVRYTEDAPRQGCCLCRLSVMEDGKWLLTKDNPAYPPMVTDPAHVARLSILSEHRRKWA